MACENDYDVIVLDVMLPGRDGFSILTEMRRKGRQSHVLMLTARDLVEDRIRGLNCGADDYLVKPFALGELIARIQALCRRSYSVKSPEVRIGHIVIDLSARSVTKAGAPVTLTPREYLVLEQLALRQGCVVSRSDIESHVYDENADLMSNVVDSTICTLRRKLDTPGETSHITTRRGLGYVFGQSAPEGFSA